MTQEDELKDILSNPRSNTLVGLSNGFDDSEELEFGEKTPIQNSNRGFGEGSEEIEKGL